MKTLYEESFEHENKNYDFKWIQTEFSEFNQIDIKQIVEYVSNVSFENETFLYFYTNIINSDAIGDKVRTMITVRYDLKIFELNVNLSDSIQAMHWHEISTMKKELLDKLNKTKW